MSISVYFLPDAKTERRISIELCVYGGTAGGVIAAVQAARCGRRTALVMPEWHVGGMSAGGLGLTDIGNKQVVGGLARDFYRQVGACYGKPEEWRFEPHVAEAVFEEFLAEANIPVFRGHFVEVVRVEGRRIHSMRTVSGLEVQAQMFIDASYEGDLMAKAGVSHAIGREPNSLYGETLNGAQIRDTHQFTYAVDPYRVRGAPGSGLLPGIEPGQVEVGAGDHRVQAYNFRMCLTQDSRKRVPFAKPQDYDATWYELLARYLAGGWREVFHKFDLIQGKKTDTNNHGAVSTDFIGQNHAWPAADYATRETIFQRHVGYQQGLMWFLSNDERVPAPIREEMRGWGLAADEFQQTQNWPHQLYVREARRLLGALVITEHHCVGRAVIADPVGMAAYGMDSHHCRRFVSGGRVWNEGDVQVAGFTPYPISFRALIPRRGECENLLVSTGISASHIAFGSIRMEPVFMVLGQSAAIAADLALIEGVPLQELDYAALGPALGEAGQVLANSAESSVPNEIV